MNTHSMECPGCHRYVGVSKPPGSKLVCPNCDRVLTVPQEQPRAVVEISYPRLSIGSNQGKIATELGKSIHEALDRFQSSDPLMAAVYQSDLATVDRVLGSGVSPESTAEADGTTPLMVAAITNHLVAARLLEGEREPMPVRLAVDTSVLCCTWRSGCDF